MTLEPTGPLRGEDESGGPGEAGSEDFGRILRRRRERAGMSQAALAGDDMHPSYISLLESGRRRPTPGVVQTLAARLGLTPDELVRDAGAVHAEKMLLAEAALAQGRAGDAAELLEPLVTGLGDVRLVLDSQALRACELYATALERTARLDEATAMWERLRAVAESHPERQAYLPTLMALVRCYRDAGDLARAVDLGEAAVRRHNELRLGTGHGYAALVSTLAGAYSERGDHLRATTLLAELIEDVEATGARDDRGYAYWNAAITAAERGQVAEGQRLAERARGLLAEGEDVRSQARLAVTQAWLMLAEPTPDADTARSLLRGALPAIREHAGAASVASAETELARCELLLGRPGTARRLAQSALKRLSPGHHISRARALTALGAALVADGDVAAGVLELEGAADALSSAASPRQAAGVWRQLSAVYRSLGDVDAALVAADRALDGAGVAAEPVAAPAITARPRSSVRTETPT